MTPSTCRETDSEMGKCKFADSWLEIIELKQWLKPVAENNLEDYCVYYKKKISVASMGINAVKSHIHGASQTDEPVLSFLAKDLSELLKVNYHSKRPNSAEYDKPI